jgi:nicotinamide mononucleotide transporter
MQSSDARSPKVKLTTVEWVLLPCIPLLMVTLTWFKIWSLPMTEVLGFASGGICVWLVVREHIANWPIGLANNIAFFFLFLSTRLYADMGLQVVYFGFGLYGWWNWLHGGENRQSLTITRTTRKEWLILLLAIPATTLTLKELLHWLNGSAPLWDSLTTVLSLAAQYLLCRKRLENWWLWILADILYIPLYLSRDLPLTALLYGLFLVMCFLGLRQWTAHWNACCKEAL